MRVIILQTTVLFKLGAVEAGQVVEVDDDYGRFITDQGIAKRVTAQEFADKPRPKRTTEMPNLKGKG